MSIICGAEIGFTLDSGEITGRHEGWRCYLLTLCDTLNIFIVGKILNMQIVYLYLKAHWLSVSWLLLFGILNLLQ